MQENLLKVQKSPPSDLAGKAIQQVNTLDGCKLVLEDGSWFLFRPSGTEPLVRCYAEASTRQEMEVLMAAGQQLLQRNPKKSELTRNVRPALSSLRVILSRRVYLSHPRRSVVSSNPRRRLGSPDAPLCVAVRNDDRWSLHGRPRAGNDNGNKGKKGENE